MNWTGVARARWRLARNALRRRRRAGRGGRASLGPVAGLAVAILLGALVCLGLAGLFGGLSIVGATAAESGVALAWVLTAALFGLLVFDLHEAVTTLVADNDLDLLRRAPIPGRALFLIKLTDALPRTSLLLVVLAIPAVVAYHAFYRLPLWGWALLPLQLLALWAIPIGLGLVFAIHLLRVVPARRAREALGLISTLTLLALWLLNSFLLPRLAQTEVDPMVRIREALAHPGLGWWLSPGHWAATAVAAAAGNSAAGALRATGGLVAAAAVALGAAALSAARHLEAAQARIAAGGGGRRVERRAAARPAPERARSVVGAILARDARLLVRDWTVLGDVLTAAVLWTLLPLVGAPLYDAATPALARAMLLALTVGLGYEVAARALPFEGRAAALMRLAPVSAAQWVRIKWLGAAALSAPLVGFAAASMTLALRLPAAHLAGILGVVVPALALALSLGLWAGAVFGRPGWTHARAMLTLGGRIWSTILLVGQAGAWLLLAAWADRHRQALPPGIQLWAPALLAAPFAVLALADAVRRLGRREWT